MDALPTIIQAYGGAGAILIVAGLALRTLHGQLMAEQKRLHEQQMAVQDKRVADAQAYAAKLLEVIDAKNQSDALLASALDRTADTVHEIRLYLQTQRDAQLPERAPDRFPVMGPPPNPGVGRKTRG